MLPTVTIDIGTTSVKLSCFDDEARLLASERHRTPTTRDAWGEIYDLEALTRLITSFVRQLDPVDRAAVQRLSITGVGESGGLVHPDLSLASPMILWHDQRGAGYLAPTTAGEREEIYRITGLPVNANYGLSKVAWALAKAGSAATGAKWLNVAEYLAATMTGERWSERSFASRTMALDLEHGTWSAKVCGLFGIDVDVFPELRDAAHGSPMTARFARETGLPSGVLVHTAGHDHMVGAVGAGLERGELLNSTGTTEGLLILRGSPSTDKRTEVAKLANGLACAGPDYTLFASIPTGGSAFATLQSLLDITGEQLTSRIDALTTRYLRGDIDLDRLPLVLPQFRGSPPPTKRAGALGVVAGIRSETTADDVILACFLGMAMQFRDVLDLFRLRPDRIKVIGPASSNPLWTQLKADLLGTDLSTSDFPEVVSRGAQALASNATPSWEACRPQELHFDAARHRELRDWSVQVRPTWEHLKAMPA
ncbi:FGGY-family carbohydrate kinase [Pseudoclavibacter terrae]|uniref:FGGY-family carbohydrate kinase n=1 Tax=Pseudoclavibacter terrae TaxID=1530195 RepID=UPI00232ED042|nr:FGGY family carbohydrate kinase [Pseudoclavibacter terrae]